MLIRKRCRKQNRPQKKPHRKIELEYNKQLSGCVYLAVQHASYFFRWGVLPVESWPTFQKSVCACSFPESRSPQPAWLSGNLAVKLSSLQLPGPFPRNIRENIRPHLPPQAACSPVHTSCIHAVYQTRARGDNALCGDRVEGSRLYTLCGDNACCCDRVKGSQTRLCPTHAHPWPNSQKI